MPPPTHLNGSVMSLPTHVGASFIPLPTHLNASLISLPTRLNGSLMLPKKSSMPPTMKNLGGDKLKEKMRDVAIELKLRKWLGLSSQPRYYTWRHVDIWLSSKAGNVFRLSEKRLEKTRTAFLEDFLRNEKQRQNDEELLRESDWPYVEKKPLVSPKLPIAGAIPHTATNCEHPDHPDCIVDHFPEENELEEEGEGGEEDGDDEEGEDRTDQRQSFGDVEDDPLAAAGTGSLLKRLNKLVRGQGRA